MQTARAYFASSAVVEPNLERAQATLDELVQGTDSAVSSSKCATATTKPPRLAHRHQYSLDEVGCLKKEQSHRCPVVKWYRLSSYTYLGLTGPPVAFRMIVAQLEFQEANVMRSAQIAFPSSACSIYAHVFSLLREVQTVVDVRQVIYGFPKATSSSPTLDYY